ncbi:hypothetical protein GQ44DRAFT_775723 [Phaeosphaeriaceae sp. PMI808]|nr:hypothetical protein GQ44DRAFT_775723 [Phaeosphaeriaceae sp. PMI808]
MDGDIVVHLAVVSGDPFSDDQAIHFEDADEHDEAIAVIHSLHHKSAYRKDHVTAPVIDKLPNLTTWSPSSSTTSPYTAPSPIRSSNTPISWTDADLNYLLSCILPDAYLTKKLTFSPPLESLPARPLPINLHLILTHPLTTPIDPAQPTQNYILVSSDKACDSPSTARSTLAKRILTNTRYAIYMLNKYRVLATLYACSTTTLASLRRGMVEMVGVEEREWEGRMGQLGEVVDGKCSVEARLEMFWLGVGRGEVEGEWIRVVEMAMGKEEGERGVWGEVYGDAAVFLGRCLCE